jgi:hypothetical protein
LIRVLQIPQALLPAWAIKQRRTHMYIAGAECGQMGFRMVYYEYQDLSCAVDLLYSQLYPL